MDKQNLYDMKLHEDINPHKNLTITRVPGGWIYTTSDYHLGNDGYELASVFVPYNKEFELICE